MHGGHLDKGANPLLRKTKPFNLEEIGCCQATPETPTEEAKMEAVIFFIIGTDNLSLVKIELSIPPQYTQPPLSLSLLHTHKRCLFILKFDNLN